MVEQVLAVAGMTESIRQGLLAKALFTGCGVGGVPCRAGWAVSVQVVGSGDGEVMFRSTW